MAGASVLHVFQYTSRPFPGTCHPATSLLADRSSFLADPGSADRSLDRRVHGHELATVVQPADSAWRFGDVRRTLVEPDARKRVSQLSGSRVVSGRTHSGDPPAATAAACCLAVAPVAGIVSIDSVGSGR